MRSQVYLNEELETLYMDYVNKFKSVHAFAEYHNMSTQYAQWVISIGRNLHNLEEVNNGK